MLLSNLWQTLGRPSERLRQMGGKHSDVGVSVWGRWEANTLTSEWASEADRTRLLYSTLGSLKSMHLRIDKSWVLTSGDETSPRQCHSTKYIKCKTSQFNLACTREISFLHSGTWKIGKRDYFALYSKCVSQVARTGPVFTIHVQSFPLRSEL